MKFVLDASVGLKTVLPETDSEKADALVCDFQQQIHIDELRAGLSVYELVIGIANALFDRRFFIVQGQYFGRRYDIEISVGFGRRYAGINQIKWRSDESGKIDTESSE